MTIEPSAFMPLELPSTSGCLVFQTEGPGQEKIEWIRLQSDGKCFVRGELVEENSVIWREMKDWFAKVHGHGPDTLSPEEENRLHMTYGRRPVSP